MRANQVVALSVAALCACHFALLGLTEKKYVLLLLLASSFSTASLFFLNSFYKNEPNATEKKNSPREMVV